MYAPFRSNHFTLRKQVLALTGVFRIYDDAGSVIAYSRQKMFKLREDIRVYTDESQSQEILYIQARQILDFSAAYDVRDTSENKLVGTLRRRGFRSMLRDQWDVLAPGDQLIGTLIEDDPTRALLRRLLLGRLLPQDYDILINDQKAADLRQRFHFFRYELDLDFNFGGGQLVDHRLGIAAAILLGAIEGKQES
jgi:uncharacterized protein YxjI